MAAAAPETTNKGTKPPSSAADSPKGTLWKLFPITIIRYIRSCRHQPDDKHTEKIFIVNCMTDMTVTKTHLFLLLPPQQLHIKSDVFISVSAILARLLDKETVGEWVKFTINIQSIYKRARDSKLRRGNTFLWVNSNDLACKCPKVKTNK